MKNFNKPYWFSFLSICILLFLTGSFTVVTADAGSNFLKFRSLRKENYKVDKKKYIFAKDNNKYSLAMKVATDSLTDFLDGVTYANAKNVRVRLVVMQKDKRLLNFSTTLSEAKTGTTFPGKFNKLKIKEGKSGSAKFVLAEQPNLAKNKWKNVRNIIFSWNKKTLTVKVKGTPLINDESNLFEFTDTTDELKEQLNSDNKKLSEKISETNTLTCSVSFNGFYWITKARVDKGTIAACIKTLKVYGSPISKTCGQWKAKGSGTMTSQGKGFLVSGSVTGAVADNVSLYLSGKFKEEVVSASDGNYSFPELSTGQYVVTPFLEGYRFFPPSQTITLENSDELDVSFNSIAGLTNIFTDYIEIPSGNFNMGDFFADAFSNELPVHSVNVDDFYINKYEVSNQKVADIFQWAFDTGRIYADSSIVKLDNNAGKELLKLSAKSCQISFNGQNFSIDPGKEIYPCVKISWYGAVASCNFLSLIEGRNPCYDFSEWNCDTSKNGYRLPTEAQWEKAARGGVDNLRFPFGNTIDQSQANYYATTNVFAYDANKTQGYNSEFKTNVAPYTAPITAFAVSTNSYSLQNMSGNIAEWCNDKYNSSWYKKSGATNYNCSGPSNGTSRVVRGGSWCGTAESCRNSNRISMSPEFTLDGIGFRLSLRK